jgi:prepilin-type N-terminal cleavage/methylation domain-containing protein
MTRGFTLLEVLLALVLIAMLTSGIFGFMLNIVSRQDAVLESTRSIRAAGALFELLEADLACVVAGDGVLGAGLAGDDRQLRVMTRRVWAPLSAAEGAAALGDLQVTAYSFSVEEGVLRATRSPAEPRVNVAGGGGAGEPIAERIEALRFRYFDGRRWLESFDSLESAGLPAAVEVVVWFGRSAGVDVGEGDEHSLPDRAPDRFRIISIPDGAVSSGGGA